MSTIVYIDGFNLYYGAVKDSPHRWLDLEEFARVLLPKDDIIKVRYFTARVSARPDDPQQPQRQATYLRALATLPLVTVHYGEFRSHPVRMRLANPPTRGSKTVEVLKTEEKGSDVNLATYLLVDAFKKRADTAVVVSNDSDLALPIEMARTELGMRVGIVNPHPAKKRSRSLQGTFFKQLRKSALARAHLPDLVTDERGEIAKPPGW